MTLGLTLANRVGEWVGGRTVAFRVPEQGMERGT
jgi:hypothetical protein